MEGRDGLLLNCLYAYECMGPQQRFKACSPELADIAVVQPERDPTRGVAAALRHGLAEGAEGAHDLGHGFSIDFMRAPGIRLLLALGLVVAVPAVENLTAAGSHDLAAAAVVLAAWSRKYSGP